MPHTMKKLLYLSIALLAFVSCEMKNDAQSTPMLYFSIFTRADSVHKDTLNCSMPSANVIVVDTINVADTVTFMIGADAVLNVLDSMSVTWDHEKMTATLNVLEEWFIKEQTDIPNGSFKFLPYYRGVTVPMVYIPTASGTHTITVFLRSSTTAYGPTSYTITQPVR